jgi:hypothetical protein
MRGTPMAMCVGVLRNGHQCVPGEGEHRAAAVRGEMDEDGRVRTLAGRVTVGAVRARAAVGTHQQVILDTMGGGGRPGATEAEFHPGDFSVEMAVEEPTTGAEHQDAGRKHREERREQSGYGSGGTPSCRSGRTPSCCSGGTPCCWRATRRSPDTRIGAVRQHRVACRQRLAHLVRYRLSVPGSTRCLSIHRIRDRGMRTQGSVRLTTRPDDADRMWLYMIPGVANDR